MASDNFTGMNANAETTEPPLTQAVPLTRGADGGLRITGSRVTLRAIVRQFQSGATAEQIQEDFPSATLGDIYAVIAWYLQHADSVEAQLAAEAQAGRAVQREVEASMDTRPLRAQLRRRRGPAAAGG